MTTVQAQEEEEYTLEDDLNRTFMPTVQMGYVSHGTDELAAGLMIQTSIEYRDISNFVLRLNYDDFNSNMNVTYPVNQDATFTGRTSFSELILGIGYRLETEDHSFTSYVQSGFRFYGYPVFSVEGTQVNLDFDTRTIGMMRYSIGYEYQFAENLFFTIEGLVGHVLKRVDFWTENPWSFGVTAGISAPIL